MLSDSEIEVCYQGVKSRLKQLYKSEPMVFMQSLPPSPGQLVKKHREFALTLFSKEDPPVSCPLNIAAMDNIKARVNMRTGKKLADRGGFDCFYYFSAVSTAISAQWILSLSISLSLSLSRSLSLYI